MGLLTQPRGNCWLVALYSNALLSPFKLLVMYFGELIIIPRTPVLDSRSRILCVIFE